MSNAIKFTFTGYIRVFAKLKKINGEEAIEISVKDTGIGIKKKNFKRIFQVFSMIDDSKDIN